MGWLWWWWWLVSCDGQFLHLLLLGIEEWVRESLTRQGREERKKHKIIDRRAIVTVHKCIILHPLMWVFFAQNV